MKTGKLKKFETVAAPLVVADTPEELAALIAELLLIAERMPSEKKIPEKPTLYNLGDADILDKKNLTLYNSGDAEKTDSGKNKFTDLELELIRQIEDAEQ
jgi:hypothetical protein